MFKKLILILILIITAGLNTASAVTKSGAVEYNGTLYSFKKGDETVFLQKANANMLLFEQAKSQKEKNDFLNDAMRYYFLLSKIMPNSIDAQIGLGRIYDEKKLDKYAKKHFYNAINIDIKNPTANFFFAEFYYKRKDFIAALPYYTQAYKHGLNNNSYLNYKMALTCEKLADIEAAKKFYENTLHLNPGNVEILDKIRLLDELNYSESQYYLFDKRGLKNNQ